MKQTLLKLLKIALGTLVLGLGVIFFAQHIPKVFATHCFGSATTCHGTTVPVDTGSTLCPDGQINLGSSGRGADSKPNCTPCSSGTVKKYLPSGDEVCVLPDAVFNYSFDPNIFDDRNGIVCRKDGQHFVQTLGDRLPTRKYDCCGIGVRQSKVAGNSYDYVCSNGGSGVDDVPTPTPVPTHVPPTSTPTPTPVPTRVPCGSGSCAPDHLCQTTNTSGAPVCSATACRYGVNPTDTRFCNPAPSPATTPTPVPTPTPGKVCTPGVKKDAVFECSSNGNEYCRSDGQTFVQTLGDRLPTRKYDCCGIGVRQGKVAGNSYEYVCTKSDGSSPPAGIRLPTNPTAPGTVPEPSGPTQLACSPLTQTVAVNKPARLMATGGSGSYVWRSPEASFTYINGVYSPSYPTTGTKTVTVTSGTASATCKVVVGSAGTPSSVTTDLTTGTFSDGSRCRHLANEAGRSQCANLCVSGYAIPVGSPTSNGTQLYECRTP